ncbi:MAG TPA: HupE/UreJ family protein [Bryobacteraceae bacterium]
MFRLPLSAVLLLCAGGFSSPAWAHSMYQAAILLDFHGETADAELQLPVERLQAALGAPNIEREPAQIADYILKDFSASAPSGAKFRIGLIDSPHWSSIEGAPYIVAHVRLTPPAGADANLFDLHCDVLLDRLPDQVFLVSVRTDWRAATFANDPQLVAVLRRSDRSLRIDRRAGNWGRGFTNVFGLGMRHIAGGTDHLLFLLALLLPAPLLIRDGRWAGHASTRRCLLQIGKVVTAFTIGHSVTLAAGAMDLVHVPARPIEALIAASILVSAVHALSPLFPGREAVVAGCFGLVHGLAFASALGELGLARWDRVASIFSFNLGIEAMQLVVVAIALPSLIILSRTRLYPSIRTAGGLFAGAVAIAWLAQRLWDLPNPIDAFVMALAQHAAWIAGGLTLLGVAAGSAPTLRKQIASGAGPERPSSGPQAVGHPAATGSVAPLLEGGAGPERPSSRPQAVGHAAATGSVAPLLESGAGPERPSSRAQAVGHAAATGSVAPLLEGGAGPEQPSSRPQAVGHAAATGSVAPLLERTVLNFTGPSAGPSE